MERMSFVVKPRRNGIHGKLALHGVAMWTGVLMIGLVLFLHVWWPIQAERASAHLKRLESELSIRKSELERLKTLYADLISLTSLERAAKANGHWIHPTIEHVITFSK